MPTNPAQAWPPDTNPPSTAPQPPWTEDVSAPRTWPGLLNHSLLIVTDQGDELEDNYGNQLAITV
jgi:hypothetical protein